MRVVVTAMEGMTCLANSLQKTWELISRHQSGLTSIGSITEFKNIKTRCMAAGIVDTPYIDHLKRYEYMFMNTLQSLLQQAKIDSLENTVLLLLGSDHINIIIKQAYTQ